MLRTTALLFLLFPAAAAAQSPPIDDVEATVVQELVVRARLPGPAWWKITDEDSTVYVLGLPESLPKGMAWDQSVLVKRLQGANKLITPPQVAVGAGLRDVPALMGMYRRASNSGTPLESRIPPALNARVRTAAAWVGRRRDGYRDMIPWLAGVRLSSDFRDRVGLDSDQPLKTIERAAKKAKVRTESAVTLTSKAVPLAREISRMSDAAGQSCLEDAVETVETGDTVVRRAAQAWAAGDVATALTAPRSGDRCLAAVPGAADLLRDSLGKQAAALEAALARPGHSVAALPLRSLLAGEGVLARLRAKGVRVQTPE